MPSIRDVCWCQCVPHIKVWEDSNLTPLSDVHLLDRKSNAERSEVWAPTYIGDGETCVYWKHDDDAGFMFEWMPAFQTGEYLWLNIIDADHHVIGRHEFELENAEQDFTYSRTFKGTVVQGVDADEFVITFDGWCRAIPMVLTIANDSDLDPSIVNATIVQTSQHVWTFTRATRDAANFLTYLTINDTTLTISSTNDTLETVEARILKTSVGGEPNGEVCTAGRYEVYRHKEQHGESTIVDPSLLFIELRLAAVQAEVITRPGQSLIKGELQVEVLPEPGWYVYGLHESLENTIYFEIDYKDERNWTGVSLAPVELTYEPDNHAQSVACRWLVGYREGKWDLRCRMGSNNGHLNETLFVPTTSEDVGLRPGSITFVGDRPYAASIEPDGSATPGDPHGLTIDPIGKQVILHIAGHERFRSGDFAHFASRTTEFTLDGFGANDGTYGNATSPQTQSLGLPVGNYPVSSHTIEWAFRGESTDDETPGKEIRCHVRILGGGYRTIQQTPKVRYDYTRAVEMELTIYNTVTFTNEYEEIFVPDDGRVVLDDVYDNPITWIRKDAGGTETVTSGRGWSQQGDCTNYEDRQYDSPVIQSVAWKNETFLLPRTDTNRWARIVATDDGEELMMLLQFSQESHQWPIGWELLVCNADDIGLPYRSIYRFIDGGDQHESQHGEQPAFSAWRPDAANSLVLIWHREHEDRLPVEVTVTPVETSNPRGTSDWSWSPTLDDWVMTSDDSAEDYVPRKPVDRGVTDTDTRTISSLRSADEYGTQVAGPETIYWSPDGIDWVLLLDNVGFPLDPDQYPTRGDAPTDPPTAEGDVYRVLPNYPE